MKVQFIKADFKDTLNNIIELINMDNNDYFVDVIFQYYPNLVKCELLQLNITDREKYISNKLNDVFKDEEMEINKKVLEYQKFWDENEKIIISKLENIFGVSLNNYFDKIFCKVGLNPICPRFL